MSPRLLAWSAGGLIIGGLLSILAWGVSHPVTQQVSTGAIGREAPELAIMNLAGGEYDLASFRGKPVVINFWASWCVPCRQEAPVLNAAARANPEVQFLGADIQDSDAAARTYQAEFGSPYPVGPIVRGSYLRFGVIAPPETYFINSKGVVVGRFLGPIDRTRLTSYIASMQ